MSLKRKAVEGMIVAGSLVVMCSIAESAGMVVVEAAPVTADAETDLETKRTAGVILYLDLVKAKALNSLESSAADIEHLSTDRVASAENSQTTETAGRATEAQEAQSQALRTGKTDQDKGIEEDSSMNVFAGASEVLACISEKYFVEEFTDAENQEIVLADAEEGFLTEGVLSGAEDNQSTEGAPVEIDPAENNSVNAEESQPAGEESVEAGDSQIAEEVINAEEDQAEAESNAEVQVMPKEEAADRAESDQAAETEIEWQNRLMADVNDFLYVRSEGSTDAEIVGKMYKGDVAEIVEAGDSWTHVVSGNVDGYVLNDYCVSGLDALEYASVNFDTQAEIQTNGLRVRSDADAESSVLTSVSTGTTLTVDTSVVTDNDWVAVKYEGTTAYVSAEYVKTELALGEAVTIEEERAAAARAAEEAAAAKAAQTAQTQTVQKTSVSASVDDVTLLAALIQCEAGSECYEGQLAVGAVVMNRVRSGAYPGSIYGVIYESGQFSPAGSGAVASVAAGGPKGSCIQAAQQALGGADNTGGATCFRRASSGQPGVVIGNHVFY